MNDIRLVPWGNGFAVIRSNPDGKIIDAYRTETWDKPVYADLLSLCPTEGAAEAALRLFRM